MPSNPYVSQSEISRGPWDVIVIGGGPAGALAARQVALRGCRTLLVEARKVPREKVCGGYLNRRALAVLEQVELKQLLGKCPGSTVHEIELVMGRGRHRFPLPHGRLVCRRTFDSLLVQAAIWAGATLAVETQAVVGSISSGGAHRTVAVTRRGRKEVLEASIVICADGLSRLSLRQLSTSSGLVSAASRIGIGAVVRAEAAKCPYGVIKMVVGRDGYVGMTRLTDDLLNVAAAVDPRSLCGSSPSRWVAELLHRSAVPAPSGLHTAVWRGTPPLAHRPAWVSRERIFVIGDAAGYVEPFTGEGISAALETAAAVAPLAARAADRWETSMEAFWRARHRALVGDRQLTCRCLAWTLRRPRVASTVSRVCTFFPAAAGRIITQVNALPRVDPLVG